MKTKKMFWVMGVLLIICACKEKYVAKTNYPFTGYLVVEGFIDAGGGTTIFRLSKTTSLDSSYYNPVSGASLEIQSDLGASFPMYESVSGQYSLSGFQAVKGTRYRLHILTAETREYFSDYAEVHLTPPVDKIHWEEKNGGIQIYLNAHDPQNATHYYKWRFDETWKYSARYYSSLIWDPNGLDSFRARSPDELLYDCWKSDTASNILLGSTLKLGSDVLADQPVTFIPYSEPSSKLYFKYSIQVYLEALAEDEYQWFDKLRKNTESFGSIFDAQPSELTGNVHSVTDPTETVIGWVGCRTVTESRIFIGRAELPSHPLLDDGYAGCGMDTLIFGKDSAEIQNSYSIGKYKLPLMYYVQKGQFVPSGIIGTQTYCADCRLKGGELMRPDFWQD